MNCKLLKLDLTSALFLALFWPGHIYADYIEGIDTTDVNGYGLDSAFRVIYSEIGGNFFVYYGVDLGHNCHLNSSLLYSYYFDEIKVAVDSINSKTCGEMIHYDASYIVKKADSTYSKLKILQKLPDGRFVYQFGSNNVPNDRVLEKSDYNRSILYKPNNLRIIPVIFSVLYPGVPNFWGFGRIGTDFYWDPPLPNNNHLLGYVLYFSKPSVANLDSLINLDQWNSTPLITTTNFRDVGIVYDSITHNITTQNGWYSFSQGVCFNIVAVYQEGRSDFLKGFSRETPPVNTFQIPQVNKGPLKNRLTVKSGTVITIQCHFSEGISTPASLAIFNLKGEQVAGFKIPQSGTISWAPTNARTSQGMYIVKAEFPDHTLLTQPFLFTK